MSLHLLEKGMASAFRAMPVAGPVPCAPMGFSWEALMERALCLAREAGEEGEVPVGALVVTGNGEIVGEGANCPCKSQDPTAHAEIMALRAAGKRLGNYRLMGCTMVVTLEPCAMCAQAIVHARLDGLVYGALDSLAGAVGSATDLLDMPFQNHRVWHMGGVLGEECASLLRDFFKDRR